MVYFNRVVVILMALAIMGAAIVTILITAGTLGLGNLPDAWLEPQIQWLADASGGMRVLVVAVSVIVAMLMLTVVLRELAFSRREAHFVVSTQQEGATTVTRESVRSLAEHVGGGIRGVHDVQCVVGEEDNGLTIACRAWVAMGASLPEVSSQLRSDIKRVAEEVTGLSVNSIDVDLRYARNKRQHLAVQ